MMTFCEHFALGSRQIGADAPCFIVAELSANHLGDKSRALEIVHAAHEAGADAVKLQTYTADTMTLDSTDERFVIGGGTLWDGRTLYDLYREAHTPWEWHADLMREALRLGMECFSSPFDAQAVSLMRKLHMPAFKIASYEITDIPLIRLCAKTKKPVILATGVAALDDIRLALQTLAEEENTQAVLLKCVSAYPTPVEDVHLRMMQTLRDEFHCVVGLSDHTMGDAIPVAATALGAKMIEKHLTLRRSDGGPDGAFSMEPEEFARMVRSVRDAERALGDAAYHLTKSQEAERLGVRSVFVVRDIPAGGAFTEENLRAIRPGDGLSPALLPALYGKHASRALLKGEPLTREAVLEDDV